MDKTYVLLLFANKPSDVYVALVKSDLDREKINSYLQDEYLSTPKWKHEMIKLFAEHSIDKKRTQHDR